MELIEVEKRSGLKIFTADHEYVFKKLYWETKGVTIDREELKYLRYGTDSEI